MAKDTVTPAVPSQPSAIGKTRLASPHATVLPAIAWTGANPAEVLAFTELHETLVEHLSPGTERSVDIAADGVFRLPDPLNGCRYDCPPGTWLVRLPEGRCFPVGDGVRTVPADRQ